MNNFNKYEFRGRKSFFNEDLFNKYDEKARDVVKETLGDFVADHPNPLCPDLVFTTPNFKYDYLELQVCTQWIYDKFPYDNVYIYERKIKYGPKCLFLVLNKLMTQGYLFHLKGLENAEPRRIKKYSRDFVFDIPWKQCLKVSIKYLDTLTIELF
jgi:hypothetical protein